MNSEKLIKILKIALIGVSLFFIVVFYYVSLSRINYPFELEWMEGGSVDHLERVINGLPIYTPPSVEFIPYIYTPLYYYAAIPFTWIFGVSLLPLRIVSLLSTSLILLLLYLFIRKETGSNLLGIISSGLFAAIFSLGGAWFDLARVDMMFILLFLASFYVLRFHKSRKGLLIAGILASLSFLTKQTASLVFLPIIIYLFFTERKLSWFFNITFLLAVFVTTAYYSFISDGWYYFWNFTLPADHRWTHKVFILFWTYDLIKPLSILILITIVYFYLGWKKPNIKLTLAFLTGTILTSYFSRLHYGGYANVLLPVYLAIILISVLGIKEILNYVQNSQNKNIISFFLFLSVIFVFTTLIYTPSKQIPTEQDRKSGWELVSLLKQQTGDVYVVGNTYFARLAGKRTFTHGLLIWDLMESKTKYNRFIEKYFNNMLDNQRFDLIIDYYGMKYDYLGNNYTEAGPIFKNDNTGWMVTGYTTRPNIIYKPKK